MPYAKGLRGPDPNKHLFGAFRPQVAVSQLPNNVSYEYLFGPIKNQGGVGTCVTFATTALMEAILHKRTGQWVPASERALYSLTKHLYEPTDMQSQGLYAGDALQVLEKTGYVLEQDFPYIADADRILDVVPPNLIHTDHLIHSFARVNSDVDSLCLALFEHGPIAIGISWPYAWEDRLDDRGFLPAGPDERGFAGGHEVVIVGYSKTKHAFRIRNSWGTAWGDHGYCWLPFASTILPDDAYTVSL